VASAARWDVVTAAWQVRANVRDALLDWQIAGRRWELLQEQITLQDRIVKRLEERAAAGELAGPDLWAPRMARQKSRLDVLDARVKSEDARTRLAAAIGLPVSALEGVKIAVDSGTHLAAALTAPAARKVALQSRSDILGALADYAAAEDDLRLEIAKQYPDVHVAPGYQFNQGDNQWLLGFSVELPVLNQNQGPIAEAEARRRLAAAKFLALQAQVINQIDQALASYRLAREQLNAGLGLVDAQQQQQASVRSQLQAGAADQFDVLAGQSEQNVVALAQLDYVAQERHAMGALEDALQHPLDPITLAAIQRAAASPNEQVSSP
jgi:outer membrane protein TolC